MPQDIEDAFKEAGKSLFPASRRELTTDCSCRTTPTPASTSPRSITYWPNSSTATPS